MKNGKITPQDSGMVDYLTERSEFLYSLQQEIKQREEELALMILDPEKQAQIARSLIIAKISKGKLTRWHKLCLWAAGYGGNK